MAVHQIIHEHLPLSSSKEKKIAVFGAVSFIILGIFNFSIDALPVLFCFSLYLSVMGNPHRKTSNQEMSELKNRHAAAHFLSLIVLGMSIWFILFQMRLSRDLYINNTARRLINERNFSDARSCLDKISDHFFDNEVYLANDADVCYAHKQNQRAISSLIRATKFSLEPSLLINLARLYTHGGQYKLADSVLTLAHNIQPTLKMPLLELARNQILNKDTIKARGYLKQLKVTTTSIQAVSIPISSDSLLIFISHLKSKTKS